MPAILRGTPPDFVWHQSSVTQMLRCPRQFYFRHVAQVQVDHRSSGYAAMLGTADHAGIAYVLGWVNECRQQGRVGKASRTVLRGVVLDAFEEAVAQAHEKGEHTDPEGIERAVERLTGERLDRLMALAEDPRIQAVDWQGIEHRFEIEERNAHRRRWKGTVDAWGTVRKTVAWFGQDGRDPVEVQAGEAILVDWKTGEPPPFGWVERANNVQLGIYGMALGGGPWRTFLGIVQDLDRPKAPTDEHGRRIPKRLPKAPNPAYAEALGLTLEQVFDAKRRPKDAEGKPIPKWLPDQPNPEYEAACAKPKGPLFREARVDYSRVLATVRDAIRQAELGLFPASGAATGQCGRCPYSTVCVQEERDDPSN